MIMIPEILIKDYDYPLPSDRIAQYPLKDRDASKLLAWKNGQITESVFSSIDQFLPENSLVIFNDTKVIHARLIFAKHTGATIEILCLEPLPNPKDSLPALQMTGECRWKCLVGNVKRWKEGGLEKLFFSGETRCSLTAEKGKDLGEGCFEIQFRWEPAHFPFSRVLEFAGLVPLPPYISRASGSDDELRYQTVYAASDGSVAAPTAGLHFSESLLARLLEKNIHRENITLHVGLGTFRPVSAEKASGHIMHPEQFTVNADMISLLTKHLNDPVIAVGTTTVRTLESLYLAGVKIIAGEKNVSEIDQWAPYRDDKDTKIPTLEALNALLKYLSDIGLNSFTASTSLMIVPGYDFKIVKGMITNFHLPQSTLLLLVAAFIGDSWKEVYNHAILKNYRFFSYGDACLFIK